MSDNNNFWNDFRNRSIYGDAAGSPKNATEHAADGLRKFGQNEHRRTSDGAHGSYEIDLDFRYPKRGIIKKFVLAGVCALASMAVTFVLPVLYFLSPPLNAVAVILALIAGWQLFVNIFNTGVGGGLSLMSKGAVRYALAGAAIFYVLDRWIFLTGFGLVGGLVIGGLFGIYKGRKKDAV